MLYGRALQCQHWHDRDTQCRAKVKSLFFIRKRMTSVTPFIYTNNEVFLYKYWYTQLRGIKDHGLLLDPRAAFGHTRPPFWWPGGCILRPMNSFLVAAWSSGPGLRSQWDTLAHFLEKNTKKSQIEVQLEIQMGRFSIHLRYLFYFVGVVGWAWHRLVSGCSFCNVLWELGKRNMDLTSVSTEAIALHIFGSRDWFSECLAL